MHKEETKMKERLAAYKEKQEELKAICIKCRKENRIFPPTIERCDSCTTGKRRRWLETEYADVTGWSHSIWNKGGM